MEIVKAMIDLDSFQSDFDRKAPIGKVKNERDLISAKENIILLCRDYVTQAKGPLSPKIDGLIVLLGLLIDDVIRFIVINNSSVLEIAKGDAKMISGMQENALTTAIAFENVHKSHMAANARVENLEKKYEENIRNLEKEIAGLKRNITEFSQPIKPVTCDVASGIDEKLRETLQAPEISEKPALPKIKRHKYVIKGITASISDEKCQEQLEDWNLVGTASRLKCKKTGKPLKMVLINVTDPPEDFLMKKIFCDVPVSLEKFSRRKWKRQGQPKPSENPRTRVSASSFRRTTSDRFLGRPQAPERPNFLTARFQRSSALDIAFNALKEALPSSSMEDRILWALTALSG